MFMVGVDEKDQQVRISPEGLSGAMDMLAEALEEHEIALARGLLAADARERITCGAAASSPYFDAWRARQAPAPKRKVLKARRPAKPS